MRHPTTLSEEIIEDIQNRSTGHPARVGVANDDGLSRHCLRAFGR